MYIRPVHCTCTVHDAHVHVHVHMYVYMYVYMYMYIYSIHMYMYMYMYIYSIYTHVHVHRSERQHASEERITRPKGDRRVSLLHPEVSLGSENCLRKHSCKHKASLWALGPLWGQPRGSPK